MTTNWLLDIEKKVLKYLFENNILDRKKWYINTDQSIFFKNNNFLVNQKEYRDDVISVCWKKIIDLESCLNLWYHWMKISDNYEDLNIISINFYKYFNNLYFHNSKEIKEHYLESLWAWNFISKKLKEKLYQEIKLYSTTTHYIFIHNLFQKLFQLEKNEELKQEIKELLENTTLYIKLYENYCWFFNKKKEILPTKYILAHSDKFEEHKNMILYRLNIEDLENNLLINFKDSKLKTWEKLVYIKIKYKWNSNNYYYFDKKKLIFKKDNQQILTTINLNL